MIQKIAYNNDEARFSELVAPPEPPHSDRQTFTLDLLWQSLTGTQSNYWIRPNLEQIGGKKAIEIQVVADEAEYTIAWNRPSYRWVYKNQKNPFENLAVLYLDENGMFRFWDHFTNIIAKKQLDAKNIPPSYCYSEYQVIHGNEAEFAGLAWDIMMGYYDREKPKGEIYRRTNLLLGQLSSNQVRFTGTCQREGIDNCIEYPEIEFNGSTCPIIWAPKKIRNLAELSYLISFLEIKSELMRDHFGVVPRANVLVLLDQLRLPHDTPIDSFARLNKYQIIHT